MPPLIGLLDSHKEERMSDLRAMYQTAFDAFVKADYEAAVTAYTARDRGAIPASVWPTRAWPRSTVA